jgi:hypothetical protein
LLEGDFEDFLAFLRSDDEQKIDAALYVLFQGASYDDQQNSFYRYCVPLVLRMLPSLTNPWLIVQAELWLLHQLALGILTWRDIRMMTEKILPIIFDRNQDSLTRRYCYWIFCKMHGPSLNMWLEEIVFSPKQDEDIIDYSHVVFVTSLMGLFRRFDEYEAEYTLNTEYIKNKTFKGVIIRTRRNGFRCLSDALSPEMLEYIAMLHGGRIELDDATWEVIHAYQDYGWEVQIQLTRLLNVIENTSVAKGISILSYFWPEKSGDACVHFVNSVMRQLSRSSVDCLDRFVLRQVTLQIPRRGFFRPAGEHSIVLFRLKDAGETIFGFDMGCMQGMRGVRSRLFNPLTLVQDQRIPLSVRDQICQALEVFRGRNKQ